MSKLSFVRFPEIFTIDCNKKCSIVFIHIQTTCQQTLFFFSFKIILMILVFTETLFNKFINQQIYSNYNKLKFMFIKLDFVVKFFTELSL